MSKEQLSAQTLRRLPLYLNYLRATAKTTTHISATQIAAAVGLGEVQVRKDLASVGGQGRPKTGYEAKRLIAAIEARLGCGQVKRFCIVGMGRLGSALAQYPGFAEYGLQLAAAFDTAPEQIGQEVAGVTVAPLAEMQPLCARQGIRIGVIAVPPQKAQAACDALASAGVHTIWNFAPAHLTVPQGTHVEHENLAANLGMLCRRLPDGPGETSTT